MPYPWECIDCAWLDPRDVKYGEYYCKYNHYYVKADSPSCRHLEKKSSSGGCYLTTLMCDILGYEDDCEILNALRGFRDNYMKNDDNYKLLLDDYDIVGPEVCGYIEDDEENVAVANVMLYGFINPAIYYINIGDISNAIRVYENMTLSLMDRYGLDSSNLNLTDDVKNQRIRK